MSLIGERWERYICERYEIDEIEMSYRGERCTREREMREMWEMREMRDERCERNERDERWEMLPPHSTPNTKTTAAWGKVRLWSWPAIFYDNDKLDISYIKYRNALKYFRDINLDFLKEMLFCSRIYSTKEYFKLFACQNCKFPAVDYIEIIFNIVFRVLLRRVRSLPKVFIVTISWQQTPTILSFLSPWRNSVSEWAQC